MQGKVFGGDNGFTWVGAYSVNEQLLKARVRVRNFDTDIKSVLGVEGRLRHAFLGDTRWNVDCRHANDCEPTTAHPRH